MKYLLALAFVWFLTLPYNAHAEERVHLIAIIFSPDQKQYADKVHAFPSKEECEVARALLHKNALQHFGKEAHIYSVCVKPRSLGAVEV